MSFSTKSIDPNIYFWLSVAIISLGITWRFPTLSIHAEMFAENGTSLFFHAYNSSLRDNVFVIKQYDYLFWFPRLIAVIAVKLFGIIKLYPHVTQWSGILLTAIFYSSFCLKVCKKILPSDFCRFFISVMLGVGTLGSFELYAFINFPYHGMFLLILLTYINLNQLRRSLYIFYTISGALIVTSKPQMIAFLPIYGVLCLRTIYLYKKQKIPSFIYLFKDRRTIFNFTITIFLIFQLTFTYIANTFVYRYTSSLSNTSWIELLVDSSQQYLKLYIHLFYSRSILVHTQNEFLIYFVTFVLICVLFVYAIRTLIKRRTQHWPKIFILCNILAFINAFLLTYGKNHSPSGIDWNAIYFPFQNRWMYLSLIGIFLGGAVLTSHFFKRKIVQSGIIVFFMIYTIRIHYPWHQFQNEHFREVSHSYSQWNLYYPLVRQKDYCIPLNPYPWHLLKNCKILGEKQSTTSGKIQLLQSEQNWNIRSVIVFQGGNRITNPTQLVAYDEKKQEVGRAKQITKLGYSYQYFLFHTKVKAHHFDLLNEKNEPVSIKVQARFMGTLL